TAQDANDGPAWFNLALAQAWLGENRKALDALERYLPLENDEEGATRAAALAQVLLTGAGLESEADWKQYHVEYQAREARPLLTLLQEWSDAGRLIVRPSQGQNVLTALVLENIPPAVVTAETASAPPDRRLAGYVFVAAPFVRLWGPDEAAFERMREEFRTKAGQSLSEGQVGIGPTN